MNAVVDTVEWKFMVAYLKGRVDPMVHNELPVITRTALTMGWVNHKYPHQRSAMRAIGLYPLVESPQAWLHGFIGIYMLEPFIWGSSNIITELMLFKSNLNKFRFDEFVAGDMKDKPENISGVEQRPMLITHFLCQEYLYKRFVGPQKRIDDTTKHNALLMYYNAWLNCLLNDTTEEHRTSFQMFANNLLNKLIEDTRDDQTNRLEQSTGGA